MPTGDRLNGWKDIAKFLGKGVRTVQRWEQDYGLPIHRLGRNGGEIIWAGRRELDEWLRLNKERTHNERREVVEAPVPIVASASRAWRRPLVAASTAVIVMLAAFGAWSLVRTFVRDTRPAGIVVKGRHLDVLNASGGRLWGHDFETELSAGAYGESRPVPFGRQWVVTDLDGDRQTELLFMTSGQAANPALALYVFNQDGTERFRWKPQNQQVTFGGTTYSGPWIPYRIFADDEAGTFFAAFIHLNEYPTLLVELDTRGRVLAEYWSNGYVETVHRGMWKGRDALFVGAASNETKGASLAIFEGHPLRGSAPAENLKYRCMDCPSGGPLEFIVFPRRDGSIADNTATVQEIKVEENGTLHVQVAEGSRNPNGEFPAAIWYTLGPELTVEQIQFTPGLVVEHAKWQKTGLVNHDLGHVDEQISLPVRQWDGSKFADLANHTGIATKAATAARK